MRIEKITLEQTGLFAPILLDYVHAAEPLRPFYNATPSPEDLRQHLQRRNLSKESRRTLVEVLLGQYRDLDTSGPTRTNIHALEADNAFTITTGHQLNIFTGPLYFIYKILTVINTAETLNIQYPDHRFVPVYWMASEDHDFEEISRFRLFGKEYAWETDQTGPVGRMQPGSLKEIIDAIPDLPDIFAEAYLQQPTLAAATRYIVNHLFGDHGIVVLDADDPQLKKSLRTVIVDDLVKHSAHHMVQESTERLQQLGYSSQVHPREINLFYMEDGLRSRIVQKSGQYHVLDTDLAFTQEEITALAESHPERFSPNVVLRPVYQEMMLPNLAYIGGPAEMAYWLQLKSTFDHFGVPYPVLMPRNFALVVGRAQHKKMEKLGFRAQDLFRDIQALKEEYMLKNAQHDFEVDDERQGIQKIFAAMQEKAGAIDPTLRGFVGSEEASTMKSLQNIEKRLKRAVEQNEQTAMKQIDSLYDKLFPGGAPQERTDNFLNFFINDPGFIQGLKRGLDPFDMRYHVFTGND